MTWAELTRKVSERAGESRAATTRVLEALLDEISTQVAEGATVSLPRVGRLSSTWREARTVRSVDDGRKLLVDGRFVARFRPATALRDLLASKTPQGWKDPAHQAAWRVAETLVGDLALYHGALAPADLPTDADPAEVERRCAAAFGSHWERATSVFAERAPGITAPLLGLSARRRWAR
jgi:nucleoid DNA-binding protein